jgi:molybdopterin-containing oxidoreductase family membrane subunit
MTPRYPLIDSRLLAPWWILGALAIVALAGLGALVGMAAEGPEPRAKWGYAAGTLAWLLSTAQTAPILALTTRLAKGYWAVPLRRAAELFTVAGLVTTPLFIVLLFQLPDWRGRWSIWFDWPGGPQLHDSLALITLSLAGLALLYLTCLPDLAGTRDAETGGRGDAARGGRGDAETRGHGDTGIDALTASPRLRVSASPRLALGWSGAAGQWRALTAGIVLLGVFYFMLLVFVHVFIVSDLAISLVPGWRSAIIPPYHGVSALQAGVATTILALFALRRFGGLEAHIGLHPFWGAAKMLLALSLLFFYFTWAELLTTWYGRTPEELFLLELLMFGPYLPLFVASFCLNFVLPFALLIWNPIRVSINGPAAVAALVVAGNLVDRLRIYVAAWSVAGPVGQHLEHAPSAHLPTLPELLVMLGAPAAVLLLYLLALRLVPPISLWEYRARALLSIERPYLRTEVAVVGKPI